MAQEQEKVNNTSKQYKRQYEWLKPYQWKKGQSGNPTGGEKGKRSLKTFVKQYLEGLSDEEKIEFLKFVDAEIVWKMAEGNPPQQNIIEGGDKPIPIIYVPTDSGSKENT